MGRDPWKLPEVKHREKKIKSNKNRTEHPRAGGQYQMI